MLLATENTLRIVGTAGVDWMDLVFLILIIIVPIVAVWRWSLLGVFIGTLTNEIIIILDTVLTYKLKSQELNYENYEAWHIWPIYMLMYCIFIWLIKCLGTRLF